MRDGICQDEDGQQGGDAAVEDGRTHGGHRLDQPVVHIPAGMEIEDIEIILFIIAR